MSRENVGVVKVAYEAFARAGLIGSWSISPMMSITGRSWALSTTPVRSMARTPSGIPPGLDRHVRRFRMELVELIDAGENTVVGLERFGGRAKLSGVETDRLIGDAFTIRDGKIARGREYLTPQQSLEVSGLRQ